MYYLLLLYCDYIIVYILLLPPFYHSLGRFLTTLGLRA